MTPAMKVQSAYLQYFLSFAMVLGMTSPIAAQALYTDRLDSGVELLVVAQPLADATSVVWPSVTGDGGTPVVVTSGDLTLVANLEAALSDDETAPAPSVIVAVGGASVSDLRSLLARVLANRPVVSASRQPEDPLVEGRLERRLGVVGSDAQIRLDVSLPDPQDPMRSSTEVLWDLLPEILVDDLAGVRSRVDGNRGLLEARTDSASADMSVSQLRLGLARIAENPAVQDGLVDAATRRLRVRRQASCNQSKSM